MEHKFANIQIAFDFSSVIKLRDHSKWRAKKNEDSFEVTEATFLIYLFI